MSDKKQQKPPEPGPRKPSQRTSHGAGRSGSARSIGEELGNPDFEPEALLDALLESKPAPGSHQQLEPTGIELADDTETTSDRTPDSTGGLEFDPSLPPPPPSDNVQAELRQPFEQLSDAQFEELVEAAVPGDDVEQLDDTQFEELIETAVSDDDIIEDVADTQFEKLADRSPPHDSGIEDLSDIVESIYPPQPDDIENLSSFLGSAPAPRQPEPAFEQEEYVDLSAEELLALEREQSAAIAEYNIEGERPGHHHLAEQGQTEAFRRRAERFEQEAEAKDDAPAKSRLLLVASELWAIVGDQERAAQAANQAHAAHTVAPLPSRQQRWLSTRHEDSKAAATTLEFETRAAPTPEARVHAALLSAEIYRTKLGDTSAARRRLDLATRAMPEDPRAYLGKLADTLDGGPQTRLRWPDADGFEPLIEAYEQMLALRTPGSPATHPAAMLLRARKLVAQRNTSALTAELAKLAKIPDFSVPASWLSASLLATARSTRPQAIEHLTKLKALSSSPLVDRALAHRALEQGDAKTAQEVVARGSLPALDGLILLMLTGATLDDVRKSALKQLDDPSLSPLLTALASIARLGTDPVTGVELSRARVKAARILAHVSEETAPELLRSLEQVDHLLGQQSLARAVSLGLALAADDPGALAEAIMRWPAAAGHTTAERDRILVSALVRELADEPTAASSDYAAVFALQPEFEAALRALCTNRSPEQKAGLLEELGEGLGPGLRKSIALLEAAHYVAPDSPQRAKILLENSREAEPRLPFADWLGERLALHEDDYDEAVRLIRRTRTTSNDSVVQAVSRLREARMLATTQPAETRELLESVAEAFPEDVAVREWLEELADRGPAADRGGWREELARTLSGPDKSALLTHAALEHLFADDLTAAVRAGLEAVAEDDNALGAAIAERATLYGGDADPLRARLGAEIKSPQLARRLAAAKTLAAVEARHGDAEAIIAANRRVLEFDPESLESLSMLEHALISEGRIEELEAPAGILARRLPLPEAAAHAWLASRIRTEAGDWERCRELCEPLAASKAPPAWAIRLLITRAENDRDWPLALRMYSELDKSTTRALDSATLGLRAAEAAIEVNDLQTARQLLDKAKEAVPDHLPIARARARLFEKLGDYRSAAETYEQIAELHAVDDHKLEALSRAGALWLNELQNPHRALTALELATQIDPTRDETFKVLHGLYLQFGESAKLAQLIEERLYKTDDPSERIELEVTRARALLRLGDTETAKTALSRALEAEPDHADALDAFAEACVASGDFIQAEQSWIRLSKQASNPQQQADLYMKLGNLYEESLPNAERAQVALNEVLKRRQGDPTASAKLARVLAKLGRSEEALQLQESLVRRAPNEARKRLHTLELAALHQEVLQDRKKAETTLERARRQWPHEPSVLRALVRFHELSGDLRVRSAVIARAAQDARRALSTGRFELSFFEMLKAVAELDHAQALSRNIESTLAALEGRDEPLSAVGAPAADVALDELLAPDLLTPQLRALFQYTGDLLDAAYAPDLKSLRAAELPAEEHTLDTQIQQIAGLFGLHDIQVLLSPTLGSVCLPATSFPPMLIIGKELLENQDESAKMFLLFRALKILQARVATLARTAPIELVPMISGLLRALVPHWQPQGVDEKKLASTQQKVEAVSRFHVHDEARTLAAEVTKSLGTRVSQLGAAAQHWGSRTALLASGELHTGFRAVSLMSGHSQPLPATGPDRLKWIMRHTDARDLAVFSVSDKYVEARARLVSG